MDWTVVHATDAIEEKDRDFLLTQNHGSIFQSPEWYLAIEKGRSPIAVLARRGGETVFAAMVERQFFPKTRYFSAMVRRGPVFSTVDDALLLWSEFEQQIKNLGAFSLSVFPYWERTDLKPLEEKLTGLGYQLDPSVKTHQHSAVIDLSPDIEEILMGAVSSKTRNMIRKGDKLGVVTRLVKDEQELETFWKMHRVTCIKKGSEGPGLDMFMEIWRLSQKNPESCACIIAELEDDMIGGCIILRHGDRAVYTWGSSTDKPMKGVPKTELVLWASVAWAKSIGLATFDLGGITPDAEKGSAAAGINRFKKGFSSEFIELFPAHYKVLNSPVNTLYTTLKSLLALLRKK